MSIGRWVVDSSWLSHAVQNGKLSFPVGDYCFEEIRNALAAFEVDLYITS
jgi:hypothetical protein